MENGLQLGPPVEGPRPRGRPKGAKNKRSLDLGRYIEAHYGGMTPGQQAAAVCLVTPRELREAKGRRALFPQLSDLMIAMVTKAEALAGALNVTKAEAWAALTVERRELMPFIHQRLGPAEAPKEGKAVPVIMMAPDLVSGQLAIGHEDHEENQALNGMVPLQVASPKSHDDTQAVDPAEEGPA